MRASDPARAGDPRALRGAVAGGAHGACTGGRCASAAAVVMRADAHPGWEGLEGRAPRTVEVGGVHVGRGQPRAPAPAGRRRRVRPRAGRQGRDRRVDPAGHGGRRAASPWSLEDDPGPRPRRRAPARPPLLLRGGRGRAAGPVGWRRRSRSILVAGIGNVFLADDGFGVEVARRLAERELPAGVKVADFGIRGMDLAYELQEDYDAAILVDAVPRGQPPGTLFVIEPELDAAEPALDAHAMDPVRVLGAGARAGHAAAARAGRRLRARDGDEPRRRGARDGAQRAGAGGDREGGRAGRVGARGPARRPRTNHRERGS